MGTTRTFSPSLHGVGSDRTFKSYAVISTGLASTFCAAECPIWEKDGGAGKHIITIESTSCRIYTGNTAFIDLRANYYLTDLLSGNISYFLTPCLG